MKKSKKKKLTLYSLNKIVKAQGRRIARIERKLAQLSLAQHRFKVGDLVLTAYGKAKVLDVFDEGYEVKVEGLIGSTLLLDSEVTSCSTK